MIINPINKHPVQKLNLFYFHKLLNSFNFILIILTLSNSLFSFVELISSSSHIVSINYHTTHISLIWTHIIKILSYPKSSSKTLLLLTVAISKKNLIILLSFFDAFMLNYYVTSLQLIVLPFSPNFFMLYKGKLLLKFLENDFFFKKVSDYWEDMMIDWWKRIGKT